MKMYEVGGCVRDEILGLKSKDIDFSVVLEGNEGPYFGADPFKKMEYELHEMGFKIFKVSPEYLTIRANFPKDVSEIVTMRYAPHQPDPEDATVWADTPPRVMDISAYSGMTVDFVLARKESDYTDGRRPDVVEPGTLEDDLARRDFTMNAIAKDLDGNYIDPHNGQRDIENKVIRAVGDPLDRLREDALRAVRALRFSVTKGFMIENHYGGLADAMEHTDVLDRVEKTSDERIREELSKMFRFDTVASLDALQRFPHLTYSMFSGTVSLDATMKTRGRTK